MSLFKKFLKNTSPQDSQKDKIGKVCYLGYNNRKLVYNAIRTPDGTLLVSRTECVNEIHEDENGETYMIGGGLIKSHTTVNDVPSDKLLLHADDLHEDIRKCVEWGVGKDSGGFTYETIEHLTDEHINEILREKWASKTMSKILKNELIYRKDKIAFVKKDRKRYDGTVKPIVDLCHEIDKHLEEKK